MQDEQIKTILVEEGGSGPPGQTGETGDKGVQGYSPQIINSLTSESQIDALSAAQGKALNDAIESFPPQQGTVITGKTAIFADFKFKNSETYTPTTENQTIESGIFLNGEQIILGDTNLVAENIKKDVSIFGVNGILENSIKVQEVAELPVTGTESTIYVIPQTDGADIKYLFYGGIFEELGAEVVYIYKNELGYTINNIAKNIISIKVASKSASKPVFRANIALNCTVAGTLKFYYTIGLNRYPYDTLIDVKLGNNIIDLYLPLQFLPEETQTIRCYVLSENGAIVDIGVMQINASVRGVGLYEDTSKKWDGVLIIQEDIPSLFYYNKENINFQYNITENISTALLALQTNIVSDSVSNFNITGTTIQLCGIVDTLSVLNTIQYFDIKITDNSSKIIYNNNYITNNPNYQLKTLYEVIGINKNIDNGKLEEVNIDKNIFSKVTQVEVI